MSGRRSSQLLGFATVLLAFPAFADCDISNYDQTTPGRIAGKVDTGTVQFAWSTDVDTHDGRNWIWHYLKNTNDHGIGYKWLKAQMRRALGSPLEPGKTDCNKYYVAGPTAPDDNAPITYGTNEASQRATVFAEIQTAAAKSTTSIIETTVRNVSGVIEDVRVIISTVEGTTNQDRWQLFVDQTQNVTVALATPKGLTAEQFKFLDAQTNVAETKLSSTGLAELYSEDEVKSRQTQPYIIFKGRMKVGAKMPAATLQQTSSDLVLLDGEARPFFATQVKLLAPDNTPK
jgi:hypothetical protein